MINRNLERRLAMNLILNDGPHPFLVEGHFVKFIDLSSLKISNLNMGRIVCIEGKDEKF